MSETHDVDVPNYQIRGLGRVNVVLGRNGCGKSTLLKHLDTDLQAQGIWTRTGYVTPERGGTLTFDPSVESNMRNSPDWLTTSRRFNQMIQFKQQTLARYRQLELGVLREVEKAYTAGTGEASDFGTYIESINGLLENVALRRPGGEVDFQLYNKTAGDEIKPDDLSSGESELISLAIECLVFAQGTTGSGMLLLDEPDVHLHPDMQTRLMNLIVGLVESRGISVLIATHSTPILSALSAYKGTRVCLMSAGQTELVFREVEEVYRAILPVFGAHPLTQVFAESRLLLVEGEDDVRIWQQAIRTASRDLHLYPIDCDGKGNMRQYELVAAGIMKSVYDHATGFSVRDRDDDPVEIDDVEPIIRLRLNCRAAENLLLSDDVLASCGISWSEVEQRIDSWVDRNAGHAKFSEMQTFKTNGYDRSGADLKEVRLVLVGQILQSNKPWEVLVGQAIGQLTSRDDASSTDSLYNYLGEGVTGQVLNL